MADTALSLSKKGTGKFAAPQKTEVANILSRRSGMQKRHNGPKNPHSVLLAAIQGAEESKNKGLEELGL